VPLGCAARCSVYIADYDDDAIKKVAPPFDGRTHGKLTDVGYVSEPVAVAAKDADVYVSDGNDQELEMIP
jgi:hypothetical protein